MLYKSWFPREKIERGKALLCPHTPSSGIPFFSSVLRRMYVISFSRNPHVGSTVLIITDRSYYVSPILRNWFYSAEERIIDLLLFYDRSFELITRTYTLNGNSIVTLRIKVYKLNNSVNIKG